jgi:hypothetical protein
LRCCFRSVPAAALTTYDLPLLVAGSVLVLAFSRMNTDGLEPWTRQPVKVTSEPELFCCDCEADDGLWLEGVRGCSCDGCGLEDGCCDCAAATEPATARLAIRLRKVRFMFDAPSP